MKLLRGWAVQMVTRLNFEKEIAVNRRMFLTSAAALALAPPLHAESFEVALSEKEWRTRLSPEEFTVLREENTERAGSSRLNDEHRTGTFLCAGCDLPLFSSEAKFESGTGWPSFYQPLSNVVATKNDPGLFGSRTEVHCRRCGGHLGHVFDDGPQPTGLRYCMNGVALKFVAG
jgi:peptide-methionine (R)-S-oxide reductase